MDRQQKPGLLSGAHMIGRNTLLSLEGPEVRPLSIRAKALVFTDPSSERLLVELEKVSPSDAPVLINGETGTGKELVARHIHRLSHRQGPFVAVNCGAISENLAESELFGHEAGAFTGASRSREGWFEAANGGTLFLDEIGDLPLSMQVKLLRVIQEREVTRVGSRKPFPVDVRLVTATNIDLSEAVSAGNFRLDLFFRLNIAHVQLSPLRQRPGDIMPLVLHFLEMYAKRLGKSVIPTISDKAYEALLEYSWPGNIRELENVVHYALLVCDGDIIKLRHMKFAKPCDCKPIELPQKQLTSSPLSVIEQQLNEILNEPGASLLNDLEELIVRSAFAKGRFNQIKTAELLGITRNVVRTLLKRHGMLDDSGGSLGESRGVPADGSNGGTISESANAGA
jgi:DNA-binding NtrC family response regulator